MPPDVPRRWRPRPRLPIAAAREPIRPAPAGVLDRAPAAVLLLGALCASVLVHVAAVRAGVSLRGGHEPPVTAPEQIHVTLVDRPPPPPAEPPKLAVAVGTPKPRFVRTRAPGPPTPAPAPPAPPAPAPVAPPTEAAKPAAAPVLMPGVALSATTATGGMAVPIGGGGPPGGGGGRAPGGGDGESFGTKPLAPAYAVDEPPVFLDNVSPADIRRYYPEEARKAKIEGAVRMKLTIDDDGTVARAIVVDDPTGMFNRAAVKLGRMYKFRPAKMGGRRVATEIEWTIHFELD